MPSEKSQKRYVRKPPVLSADQDCCERSSHLIEVRPAGKPGVAIHVYQCADCGETRTKEITLP